MPQSIPPRPRTVEQKMLDLILRLRSLNEEASGIHDYGQATGISEELNAIEHDMDDLMQMMEGRVYRLRQRVKVYCDRHALDELMMELPEPR